MRHLSCTKKLLEFGILVAILFIFSSLLNNCANSKTNVHALLVVYLNQICLAPWFWDTLLKVIILDKQNRATFLAFASIVFQSPLEIFSVVCSISAPWQVFPRRLQRWCALAMQHLGEILILRKILRVTFSFSYQSQVDNFQQICHLASREVCVPDKTLN